MYGNNMNKAENPKDDALALPWEAAFARSLARLRLKHGMSQTELARRATAAGLPLFQQQIQRIENLARPVRLNEAVLLAQVLNGDPWAMASKMVEDQGAFEIVKAAQDAAAEAAHHTIRMIRDEWNRLDAAVNEADERVVQYIRYTQERGAEKYAQTVESALWRQARLTATREVLDSSVLAKVLNQNNEPRLADAATEDRKS
jgi:transcriptional regulator with XRE-family HTH domain